MNIYLKIEAKEAEPKKQLLKIEKRLPGHVLSSCEVTCEFQVREESNYYLLQIKSETTLQLQCQRCLHPFHYEYHHEAELAVCAQEKVAESLMHRYECIVSDRDQIDLQEIITDDLHLFLPEKHIHVEDCDPQIRQMIQHEEGLIQ